MLKSQNPIEQQPGAHKASIGQSVMSRQLGHALQIVRMKQLIERTRLSRSTLYVLMASDPSFPRKIKLTARTVGFDSQAVDAWIASRAAS